MGTQLKSADELETPSEGRERDEPWTQEARGRLGVRAHVSPGR